MIKLVDITAKTKRLTKSTNLNANVLIKSTM